MKIAVSILALTMAVPSIALAQDVIPDDVVVCENEDVQAALRRVRAAEMTCEIDPTLCGRTVEVSVECQGAVIKEMESRKMLGIGAVRVNSSTGALEQAVPNEVPSFTAATTSETPAVVREVSIAAPSEIRDVKPAVPAAGQTGLRVNFALGSDELIGDSMFDIQSFAVIMKNAADAGVVKYLNIEGHADSSGSAKFNEVLSEKRAKAVRDALVRVGVDSDLITYEGFGSRQPLPGLAASHPSNRRVEAVLLN